ncbi:MAG: cysteine peptidase family C39 domain-containing protein [Patescibacteria group bacterium]
MTKHLKVKPFQETLGADMCGPASLKIVLDYYGLNKSEKELAKLVGTTRRLGTDERGLTRAARQLGFKVIVKNNSSFGDIEKWLHRGVPPIVDWFTRGRADYSDSDIADGHYSVACGIDSQYIYLQDPEIGGIRKIEKNDFKRVWFDFRGEFIDPSELIIRQLIAIYKK